MRVYECKLPFGIPMIWQEPRDHSSDCFLFIVKTSGYKKKNKCKIEYPSLLSAIHSVPRSAEIPVPVLKEWPFFEIPEFEYDEDFEIEDDFVRERFDHELNDLARYLGLFKKASEPVASRLREKNLLGKGATISYLWSREREFLQYFRTWLNGGVGTYRPVSAYNPTEWRLFIDSSKWSLKCVLLHNKCTKRVNDWLQYHMDKNIICSDLKMNCFLLGQQCRYTKYPCFLCM